MGTILSVNHDYWGTIVTYFGYFLLFGSLIVSLFTRKTRFTRVSQQIKETHDQRRKLLGSMVILLLFFGGTLQGFAQDSNELSKEHASSFGRLLIQNKDGRIIPVNTISNQVLVKIYKKSSFENLSADQVFLGMISNPNHWKNKAMIKVGDPALQSILGINGNYARYNDFFNDKGHYKIKKDIDEAYAKKPALRNMFDKELIYVDERMNVCYMVYSGSLLKIFPIPNHRNNKWASPLDFDQKEVQSDMAESINLFTDYFDKLNSSIKSRNYTNADLSLQNIREYQA